MKTMIVLTVSESKRLIAKGVANYGPVIKALEEGVINLPSGTTNGYIAEELLGEDIDKSSYVTGCILPSTEGERLDDKLRLEMEGVVLKEGALDKSLDRLSAMDKMNKGDVLIKGGNALNYDKGVAGIFIGSATGGTWGGTVGQRLGKRIEQVVPIGLEKQISTDIYAAAEELNSSREDYTALGLPNRGNVPRLAPLKGTIITGIEAIEILTEVSATQVGSGGVGGAEGAVCLSLEGAEDQLNRAVDLIKKIQGESAFI